MPKPWRSLASESLLDLAPWLELRRESWELPDGRRIDDFYELRLPAYAVIVALTPDGRLIGEWHFRPGARQVTLALPSGYVDANEDPMQAAQRELHEETGYEASSWSSLGRFIVDGNRGCGTAHLFLAQDAKRVSQPDGKDLAEVEIELLTLDDFVRAIDEGRGVELATAAAIGLARARLHP
jgi:ADP-ribose pyrophosphatase